MSRQMSTSPAASQPGMIDPQFESLIDFSEYDNNNFQSPSMSPAAPKAPFARPQTIEAEQSTTGTVMPAPQPLNGPSHQYEMYKQQTGLVPGALASTHAVNQNNSQVPGYSSFNVEEYLGMSNPDNMFDFNTAPAQGSMSSPDMDMEFDSPNNDFFYENTVNPSSIGGQEPHCMPSPPVLATQSGPVGRMWPGMHQQAALAKAQAQQRQQQQIIQQQQHQRQQSISSQQSQPKQAQRPKNAQPTDPIVEQKITQLLNSMRVKPSMADANNQSLMNIPRPRKDEEDMDDDERLLASEEGKKLSSKERRQLRNKVSARAFRSRRKEYITQLESEIASKVTENGDLRAQNRALLDENKRLSDLTRMLLASPSFSDFLDRLSTNPQMLPHTRPEPQPQVQQGPKDVSAYAAQQQMQQQNHQIGMAMIPEQTMDFNMLNLGGGDAQTFNYQPQVYTVMEPEYPPIDTSLLSGKTSNFVGEQFDADDEKVDAPVISARPAAVKEEAEAEDEEPAAPVDEEFENDPQFALYHDAPAAPKAAEPVAELDIASLSLVESDNIGGVESEKVFARYELVDSTEAEDAELAMARVQRISAGLESTMARLEMLMADL